MKKILAIILIICIFNMMGCSNIKSEKTDTKIETTMDIQKKNIKNKMIANVFDNKEKFYDTESLKYIYLRDYSSTNYMVWSDNGKYEYINSDMDGKQFDLKITRWCETDMDSNGNKEVLIEWNSSNILVLHSENNVVYGYAFPFRGMNSIKKDGTFQCSGSAANIYIGKLEFNAGDCFYNEICAIDELDENNPIYRINMKESTKEAVQLYLKEQETKEDVLWNDVESK